MTRSTRVKCIGLYRTGLGYESPESQLSSIKNASRHHDFDLQSVKDLSSKNFEVSQMIFEVLDSGADGIAVWRLDCLAPFFNDLEGIVSFISELLKRNLVFISVQDGIDSDMPVSEFITKLNASWFEFKSNRKIENGRRSAMKAKINGNKPGPRRKRDDQKIFEMRESGLSIRKIANEMGFSPGLIHQVLKKMPKKTTNSKKRLPTEV